MEEPCLHEITVIQFLSLFQMCYIMILADVSPQKFLLLCQQ